MLLQKHKQYNHSNPKQYSDLIASEWRRRKIVTLKTSSRCFQYVLENKKYFLGNILLSVSFEETRKNLTGYCLRSIGRGPRSL